jgi:membrane protein DedA with SNARE-associated domain
MDLQAMLMLDDDSFRHFLDMAIVILFMTVASILACYASYAKGRMDAAKELEEKLIDRGKKGESDPP